MTIEGHVKFGIALPQIFSGPRTDPAMLQRFLEKAETSGFHSVWVQEQVLGRGMPSLEPVALLSYAGGLTRRLRLGTAVLLTPLRSPVQLAKALDRKSVV